MGMARCGTTATSKVFAKGLDGFATPAGVKELKYFLKNSGLKNYLKNFKDSPEDIIFESSPPYMHSGMDAYKDVIERILQIRDEGADVHLLFHVRNLTKRAFSHYWHDINGQYSIFGKRWSIKDRKDPKRFAVHYRKSFEYEISADGNTNKFRPELAAMLDYAVELFGQEHVHIAHLGSIDECIRDLLQRVSPQNDFGTVSVPRTPGARTPKYLPGAPDQGTIYSLPKGDDVEEVEVPPNSCVLLARRHAELLDGDAVDIPKLLNVALSWTQKMDTSALPEDFKAYLTAQASGLLAVPERCFLAGCRSAVLDDIASIPAKLAMKTRTPKADEVLKLIWEKQSENAEMDGKVTVGRNKRLFLHYDMNKVLPQHLGKDPLNDEQLDNWSTLLEERRAYSADAGIHYGIVFAPDTHAIYREDLPVLDNVTAERPMQQLLNHYSGSEVCYPLEALRDARALGEVCDVTDSHWSPFGAYVAYKTCLPKIKPNAKLIDDADIKLREQMVIGDLGAKFIPPRKGRTTQVTISKATARKVWNNGVSNRGHMSYWVNTQKDLSRAILLTDSYGWRFQRFLAESFSNLFVVHSPLFETALIEMYKPDTVISLMAERFVPKVPRDGQDATCLEMAISKDPTATLPDFNDLDRM